MGFWLGNEVAESICKEKAVSETFYHKLGDLEVKSAVLEASSLKSQYWCGHLPQKALQEAPALPLPGT